MEYSRAESGQRIFTPENKIEWRGMATGMNEAARRLGIPPSQRAKYDLPDWALVATFLPGVDQKDQNATPAQISERLLSHNIKRTRYKVSAILYHMMHLSEAIHPHRRSIGQSCFQLVKDMGGVKRFVLTPEQTGLIYDVYAYYFGKKQDEVAEVRREYGLFIRG